MSKIVIHQDKISNPEALIEVCPFDALEVIDNTLQLNSNCKICKLCVKREPAVFEFIKSEKREAIDKSMWSGIAVYIDHIGDEIHPVSYELLGKARELAKKVGQQVYAVIIGNGIQKKAADLLYYHVDAVYVYEHQALEHFRIEPYTAAMSDFIDAVKPAVVLVGGTTVGRSLAPRTAARFKTGLTADCTILDIQDNSDLDQIRPAFGGNIMAHIHTPNHRPQFATVRYKIFDAPTKNEQKQGNIIQCSIDDEQLKSNIMVRDVHKKEREVGLEDADVIIVAGRGIKKEDDLKMIYELAELLNAEIASTRPLIEAGWGDPKRQIGLSGRTVKPKLLITCGVSGSVQFIAGMQGADEIFAINIDKDAPIFNVAHYGVVGDIYDIVPALCEKIKLARENRG